MTIKQQLQRSLIAHRAQLAGDRKDLRLAERDLCDALAIVADLDQLLAIARHSENVSSLRMLRRDAMDDVRNAKEDIIDAQARIKDLLETIAWLKGEMR